MANILKGIDKIVTTQNTEIDLENIQASGGSGGTSLGVSVSAAGLAISKQETTNEIGYYFNLSTAKIADGHSISASHFMVPAGSNGSPLNSVDMVSFDSASAIAAHGTTNTGSDIQVESNGSIALLVSGYNGGVITSTSLKDFSDSTVHTDNHGSLSTPTWDGAAMSDGDKMIVAGGYNSSGAEKRSEIIAFADTSTFSAWGDMVDSGAHYHQGSSNGSIGMMAGGSYTGSTALNYYQSLSFSSDAAATQHGSMSTARWGNTAVSNATILIVSGAGGGGGGGQDVYQEKYAFDAQSAAVAIGNLDRARRACAGGSSGTEYIIAGGVGSGDVKESTSEKSSFEDNATSSDWSSMGAGRGWVQGTSGNA